MPSLRFCLAIACFLLVQAGGLPAMDPGRTVTQFIHSRWTCDQGLPQNSVFGVLQARDQYIWFGTQEGLVRFNGAEFVVFDKESPEAIPHNDVRCLIEDPRDGLWIGTWGGGLAWFHPGQPCRVFDQRHGLPDNLVNCLLPCPDGGFWIGTNAGLARMSAAPARIVRPLAQLSGRTVRSLCMDHEGTLWVGTYGAGLWRIAGDQVERVRFVSAPLENNIAIVREDGQGRLWIGTSQNGVYCLDRLAVVRHWPTAEVNDLCLDRDGGVWVATLGGVVRFVQGRREILDSRQGLNDDYVWTVWEDRQGCVWIGTSAGGLHRLSPGRFRVYTRQDGLPHDYIRVLRPDHQGRLWVGTFGGGVACLDRGRFRTIGEREGLSNGYVRTIAEDARGNLWVGTLNGLNRIDEAGRITVFRQGTPLLQQYVWSTYCDRAGDLWIGTDGGGLQRWRDASPEQVDAWSGISSQNIRCIMQTAAGDVWFGTNGDGILRFSAGKFRRYTTADGLPSNVILCLVQDRAGMLWAGTSGGGIALLDQDRWRSCGMRQGMFNDSAFQVLEDPIGYFWITCNKGIFRVSRNELRDAALGLRARVSYFSFGVPDGLLNTECNGGWPGGCATADGQFWFPTIQGIAVIEPTSFHPDPNPIPVRIEQLKVDGRAYDFNRDELRKEMRLPPGVRNLEFHYIGLWFDAINRIHYRYILEGFDPLWNEAETRRVAYYTNLSPGKYTFRVMACNNDGIWTPTVESLAIVLEPWFHQTWIFRALTILALLLIVLGGQQVRIASLKRRKQELAELVKQRTAEVALANTRLEEANLELQRLALQDALTGLANRRRLMETLETEWRRAHRLSQSLCLIMIDIDYFKAYNDHYGHQGGDGCLRAVAGAIQRAVCRPGDLAGRYGGEEFAVLLPATELAGGKAVAERLRSSVLAAQIPHAGSEVAKVVTISLGVACVVPPSPEGLPQLIEAADQALYQAKHQGRNRWLSAGTVE